MIRFERHLAYTNLFVNVMEVSQPQKAQLLFVQFHPRRQRMMSLDANAIVFVECLYVIKIECIYFHE